MKKNFFRSRLSGYTATLTFLWMLLAFCACKENKLDESGTGLPPLPDEPESSVSFSCSFLDVSCQSITDEVTVTASTGWTVKTVSQWIHVTPDTGTETTGQTLAIRIDENTDYSERTGDIIITSLDDSSADTLTVRQFGISAFIPVDYEKNPLVDFNPATGKLVLDCSNGKPTLRAGASLVVPTDTVSYIRIVEQVSEQDGRLELQTSEGDMTDIFVNQEFTLSTEPAPEPAMTRGGRLHATDRQGVIHPVKINVTMSDGSVKTLYDLKSQLAGSTRGDIINAGGSKPFFNKSYNKDGEVFFKKGGAMLKWEKCNHQIYLGSRFHFTFGENSQIEEDKPIKIPKGELLAFWCYLDGSMAAEMLLKMQANSEISGKIEDQTLSEKIIGPKDLTFFFNVGAVPVVVNVNADMMLDAGLSADGESIFTAGAAAQMQVKAGFEYVQGDKNLKSIWNEPDSEFSLYKPQLTAKANVDAYASLYPLVHIRFFNFAGPDIAIKPYLLDHLEFDGRASTDGDNFARWSNRLYYRMEMEASLELDFVGIKWNSASLTVTTPDKDLHRTPDKIKLISPENGSFQEEDEPITVTLSVEDFSIAGLDEVTADATVQFVPSKGVVDASVAVSNSEGEVTVNWTPDPETRSRLGKSVSIAQALDARLLGKDDRVISQTSFVPDLNRDREILEAFYHSAGGPGWSRQDNWCSDKPLDEWYGVQTNHSDTLLSGRVWSIDLSEVEGIQGTADFRGLSKLQQLDLGSVDVHKGLTQLNVAGCTELRRLNCRNHELVYIDLSGCENLYWLMLHDNKLTSLPLNGVPSLVALYCSNNLITGFDFTPVPDLSHLVVSDNPYISLDVSMLTRLDYIDYGGEKMRTPLTLSPNNSTLTGMSCDGGTFGELNTDLLPRLTQLSVSNTSIHTLTLSKLTQLKELRVLWTSVRSLDLSQLRELSFADFRENTQLTNITATALPKLEELRLWKCYGVKNLQLSACPKLKKLDVSYNGLTVLNTSHCPELESLICNDNQLRNIDISYCPKLSDVRGANNVLETLNVAGTRYAGDLEDYRLRAVTIDETGFQNFYFPGWGAYDKIKYSNLPYRDGWQYPHYTVVR